MKLRWSFSALMLAVYVSLFALWFYFPSRWIYLVTGTLAVVGLAIGMRRANRNGYFVNNVDWRLHALVIVDLVLETISFEVFRLFQANPANAAAELFHRNTNFFGCASAFALLIGCYRLYSVRREPALPVEATVGAG